MTLYHVQVSQDGDWLVGRVLERVGVTTQGKTLDELLFMVRDAIRELWGEEDVQLEMIVPSGASRRARGKASRLPAPRKRSTAA